MRLAPTSIILAATFICLAAGRKTAHKPSIAISRTLTAVNVSKAQALDLYICFLLTRGSAFLHGDFVLIKVCLERRRRGKCTPCKIL